MQLIDCSQAHMKVCRENGPRLHLYQVNQVKVKHRAIPLFY